MKTDEELLEEVVSALGETEPAPGMEVRILQGIEARVAAGLEGGPVRFFAWRWPAFAVAGLLMLLAGWWAMLPAHPDRGPVRDASAAVTAGLQTPSTPASPRGAGSLRVAGAPRAVIAGQHPHAPLPAVPALGAGKLSATARGDSFPAPPLPLTEQERLLLQIAHRRQAPALAAPDPAAATLLAALDPASRELREARETAEFQTFFPPKVIPKYPEAPQQPKKGPTQ